MSTHTPGGRSHHHKNSLLGRRLHTYAKHIATFPQWICTYCLRHGFTTFTTITQLYLAVNPRLMIFTSKIFTSNF